MRNSTLTLGALLFCFSFPADGASINATVVHSGACGVDLTDMSSGKIADIATGDCRSAVLSPDGRRIAYYKGSELYSIHNDGTGETLLNNNCRPDKGYIHWTEKGIYWMQNYALIRVDVTAKTRHTVHTFSGDKSQGTWMAKDGLRGIAWVTDNKYTDPRFVISPGLDDITISRWKHVSHGQTISCDGKYVIFNDFKNQFNNPNYLGHKSLVIQKFESTTIGEGVVGFANFPTMSEIMPNHHPMQASINSPYHLVCQAKDMTSYIVNWQTEDIWEVPRQCSKDFYLLYMPTGLWIGDLPAVSATEPRISLDKSTLQFGGDGTQEVAVTNTGAGTLGELAVSVDPSDADWLTTTVSGEGNSQTVTNTVTSSGLADGSYSATVSVSGGGASNAATYTVALTVGSALAAPTGLGAEVLEDTTLDVKLTWTDNADGETGYAVERKDTGDWREVGTVAADVSTYLDVDVQIGTHTYRVRARGADGDSPYSAELKVVVDGAPTVFVTSPVEGDVLAAGSTVDITWTSRNINTVEIKYSTDDGKSWTTINSEGGVGDGQEEWGAFPWSVPDIEANKVRIHIHEYGTDELGGYSGYFAITRSSQAMRGQVPPGFQRSSYGTLGVSRNGSTIVFHYAVSAPGWASLSVLDLQGSVIASRRVFGSGTIAWDTVERSGTFLVRLGRPSSGSAAVRKVTIRR